MTTPTPPFAAIDGILARTRHLLLDFDGVVCRLYAAHPRSLAADRLRAVLSSHGTPLPESIISTTDPLAVLSFAATIGSDLAGQADAELVDCELDAIPSAEPTGYVHDVIASARESGRTATIISTCSARAVNAYLEWTNLADLVGLAVAPHPRRSGIHLRTQPHPPRYRITRHRTQGVRIRGDFRKHARHRGEDWSSRHRLHPRSHGTRICSCRCDPDQPGRPRAQTRFRE